MKQELLTGEDAEGLPKSPELPKLPKLPKLKIKGNTEQKGRREIGESGHRETPNRTAEGGGATQANPYH